MLWSTLTRLDRRKGAPLPEWEGGKGRALRQLPEQMLAFAFGEASSLRCWPRTGLNEEALTVVQSIGDELDAWAQATYEDLMRNRPEGGWLGSGSCGDRQRQRTALDG